MEAEDACLARVGILAGARRDRLAVGADVEAQADAGTDEGPAGAPGERQPERVGLDGAARDDRAPDRDGGEAAGQVARLDAHGGEQPPGLRVGAAEDVPAEVEPGVVTRLAAKPAADAIGRLEHDHVAVAQVPGGGQPGEPAADDDDLAALRQPAVTVRAAHHEGTEPRAMRTAGASYGLASPCGTVAEKRAVSPSCSSYTRRPRSSWTLPDTTYQ